MPDPLLSVRNLTVKVDTDEGVAHILDSVSIEVRKGEILGVVGESGCGKSTLVKTILGVLPRGARIDGGQVLFEGIDLLTLDQKALIREIRGSRIGFIPQDPYLAFNPVFKIGTQFLDQMRWHAPKGPPGESRAAQRKRHRAKLVGLMRHMQIADPEEMLDRYPTEVSGGQRQRLMIAAALSCEPVLLMADEPTSAIDVTTQQQILILLRSLVREFGLSVVFVSHDFGVVAQLCDTVTVMYAGQIVEHGSTEDIIEAPRHPYTQMLLRCHPDHSELLTSIPGSVSSPTDPPPGCRFGPRCDRHRPECSETRPAPVVVSPGREVHCVIYRS